MFTGYHFSDQASHHPNGSTTSCVRTEKANTRTRGPLELLENVTYEFFLGGANKSQAISQLMSKNKIERMKDEAPIIKRMNR